MIQKIFKKYQNQKSDEICTLCYKLCWHFPFSKIAISDKFTENYENLKNRKFWTPFWNKVPFKNYVISKSAFFYPLLPPWDDIVYGRPLRMKKSRKMHFLWSLPAWFYFSDNYLVVKLLVLGHFLDRALSTYLSVHTIRSPFLNQPG